MSTGTIYLIRNQVNQKVYVGLTTTSLAERWAAHKSEARRGAPDHKYRAMRQYGIENFTIDALEYVPVEQLSLAESKWIAHFDSTNPDKGYNKTHGGERPVFSAETRTKISASLKGRTLSEEHKQSLSAAMSVAQLGKKRKPHSQQTKTKMALAKLGKKLPKHSQDIVEKRAASNTGKKRSAESRERLRQARLLWWANKKALIENAEYSAA
jgi:group I intron endonuclease